jgi:phytoene dehydrogenase-like protein
MVSTYFLATVGGIMTRTYDAIFVGSGISSLVGAALLGKGGMKVGIFERNPWIGGNIRSAEITEPGFIHDLYSAWHPLFVGGRAWGMLGKDLTAQGLDYAHSDLAAATLLPDGSAAFISGSHDWTVRHFGELGEGDGEAWDRAFKSFMAKSDIAFGMMGIELWSIAGLKLLWKIFRQLKVTGTLEFGSELMATCRQWLTATFKSPAIHGLLAPWVLHTGLGPDNATSGFMTQLIAAALELVGMPIPRGGAAKLIDAFIKLITAQGGEFHRETPVEQIIVRDGRAVGVRTAAGEFEARRAIACCVTPHQLYLKLLDRRFVPDSVIARTNRFRYGRGDMQIHLALSEPPQWHDGDERFLRTAMVHVTDGINGVSRAVNEAERGLLPADPTVVVGQPIAVDPTRAPAGRWIFWLQLQEMPSHPRGDAAGKIPVADGSWTTDVRERMADRIIDKLARQIPNLKSSIMKRVVLSPADLEAANPNLVGGDPYAGACTPEQFFIWRPLPGMPCHRTFIRGLYHIGASTHPGPGLHGITGVIVAEELLGSRKLS